MNNFSKVFIGVVIYIGLQVVFSLLWGVTFLLVAFSRNIEFPSLILYLGFELSFALPVMIAISWARRL